MNVQRKSGRFGTLRLLSCSALAVLAAAQLVCAQTASAQTAEEQTVEEQQSPTLDQIHARGLEAAGATGSGVTVAVIDTGILASHPEFGGRVLKGYNALERRSIALDGNGHGTHVAGTIGAAKDGLGILGVAYEVTLLPIKVLDDDGFGSDASVARGIRYAVKQRGANRPFAINMSLGGSGPAPTIASALKAAVRGGMLIAIAAGNSGGIDPDYPAYYAAEPWAKGQIIAVGAVDASNRLASFSNRAGVAKNFFLVAPGVRVVSAFSEPGPDGELEPSYARLSGTSMATPHVTGAAAALKSSWMFLTGREVASILFASARDLGAPGVDEVYGRGLLDLEAALRPIGELKSLAGSGTPISMRGTALFASAPVRGALAAAARAGRLRMAVFDGFGRDFQIDLGSAIRPAERGASALGPLLEAVDAAEQRSYSTLGGTLRVAQRSPGTRFALGQLELAGRESGWGDAGFSVSRVDAGGREVSFGFSGMGAQSFGLAGELARRGDAPLAVGLANPYFSLAAQHMHVGVGLPLRGGLRVKVGALLSDPRSRAKRRQHMGWAELAGGTRAALWSIGAGRLQEEDSVLGTAHSGALRFRGTAGTTAVSAGVAVTALPRLTVGAQYTLGRTAGAENRTDSLVSGYTSTRSEACSVFAALASPFSRGDSLSLTVSRPLRAVSGRLRMRVPVRADENGAPVTDSRSIALAPEGRETRADLLYLRPIHEHARWFVGVGLRHQPDHDPRAPIDVMLGGGLRGEF
jgi:hypothetical protein